MNPRLPLPYQPIAALALLVMTVVIFMALLMRPFMHLYQERNTEIEDRQSRLRDYRAAADSVPALAQQIEQFRHDPRIAARHLKNTVSTLAGAELQQHIQRLAEQHGARLVSMQIVKDHADAPHAVTIRIRLHADTTAVLNLLFALESGSPRIVLNNLFLRTFSAPRGSADSALDIGFDASAYTLGWAT